MGEIIQGVLLSAKSFGYLEDISWWVIFTPFYVFVILNIMRAVMDATE